MLNYEIPEIVYISLANSFFLFLNLPYCQCCWLLLPFPRIFWNYMYVHILQKLKHILTSSSTFLISPLTCFFMFMTIISKRRGGGEGEALKYTFHLLFQCYNGVDTTGYTEGYGNLVFANSEQNTIVVKSRQLKKCRVTKSLRNIWEYFDANFRREKAFDRFP